GGVCTASKTISVTVVGQDTIKPCITVASIQTEFSGLKDVDPKNIQAFIQVIQSSYNQMLAFFKQIGPADGLAEPAQTDQFVQANTVSLLSSWIATLTSLLQQSTQYATLIVALVDILTELIEHIGCFQTPDAGTNTSKLPMIDPLNRLQVFCRSLAAMLNSSTLTATQKSQLTAASAQITRLKTDLNTEIARLNSSNEKTTKPLYLALLQKVLQMLQG
ncbi:MAG TPA: hypothetical protein VHC47_02390, partial [Mucilaginibacter sp.]|nr:hypothetical protein [Mucilaginibacter sp.]